ncbi:MAG: FG-GAP-like repeat-containing protein [Pyrinomonadaceae bacterium]
MAQRASAARREDAYRANNLGVALLEQYKYKEGVEEFRRALTLDPQLALAQVNLGIALFNVPDVTAAEAELKRAQTLAPNAPQPAYVLGLIARGRDRADEAVGYFTHVLKIDPQDVGAHVQLGQLYAQQRNYTEAIRHLRAALAAEPYNNTALYNLATALLRSGAREEGQAQLQRFQTLRQSGAGTTIGQNYLEQGRYAEAVVSTGAEPELVDKRTPNVTFTDATTSMLPARAVGSHNRQAHSRDHARLSDTDRIAATLGGAVVLFDLDDDGDLDLFDAAPTGAHLYRNDAGRFVDVTARSGAVSLPSNSPATAVVAGDYDNDGRADLLVLRADGHNRLYRNEGGGKFIDATVTAGISAFPYLAISAAFADVDHDGDLDIFIGGYKTPGHPLYGAPNLLLRNNGNGTFTDITTAAKVGDGETNATAIVPTDFDNRRDVDLLVVHRGAPPSLFRNLRDGSFSDVAQAVGLTARGFYTAAAAGDVNKDGYTDFFFGAENAPGLFAISDGRTGFKVAPAPATTKGVLAAQFLDYDNDGLLDLLLSTTGGVRVWRNVGSAWVDVSARAVATGLRLSNSSAEAARVFASGDLDGDGDTDLVLSDAAGRLRIARNEGGNRNRSVAVRLAGKVSNRTGVEAKVEVRAGSLAQKLETYAASPAPAPADLVFGLGARARADAVRVVWPSGTVQAETEFAHDTVARHSEGHSTPSQSLTVTELDRKPSSCPFLYTWNGARFEFVTDFMGGGEMGDWIAPGQFNTPDPDEYVRITGAQLKPKDGRYELRMTNELEEAMFVDRVQLVAVAHPADVEVYPNEGLRATPPAFKLYATHDARPPVAAHDGHGHDVRARIAQLDRRYPDDFKLGPLRGYAAPHALTLDLGLTTQETKGRVLLLLTGWTDYAFSSDNVAATQQGLEQQWPALQVKDAKGEWQTVVEDVGIPVGRPQTLVVDLTGKLPAGRREVRLVTNLRVYWDRILVDTSGVEPALQLTRLDPLSAELHWRGYSAEFRPDGRVPESYDYARVSQLTPWKLFPGRYTREGDVRELLTAADDMFVVSRTGDELSLSFDAMALPPLPAGWMRTFLLYADGFSKEMNVQSASPDVLAPLPFHGMTRYPYSAPETYPLTPARADYIERYNTRVVTKSLPELLTGER